MMMNARVVVPSAAAAPSPYPFQSSEERSDAVHHVAQVAFLVLPHAYAIMNEMK
jgi:hypothetical protein